MKQKCPISQEDFEVTERDLEFYRRMQVPVPDIAPLERLRRRFGFRHGGQLHRISCDATGKSIVSMHSADREFPVYDQDHWWSDAWDPLAYGQQTNLTQPFFSQFAKLNRIVPRVSLVNTACENSYFTNNALYSKNCYLVFGCVRNEDVQYGYYILSSKDTLDGLSLHTCELCYDGVSSTGCYGCVSFTNCRNCVECVHIADCLGCTDCIGCVGLSKKRFCVLNEEVGEKAYYQIRESLFSNFHSEIAKLKQRFATLCASIPRIYAHLHNCEDCTGDVLFNSRSCEYAFDCRDCEDCKYLAFSADSFGSYDCCYNGGGGVQFSYECVSTLATESRCNAIVWNCSNTDYCMECHNSEHLFGCIGLKKAKYCILNTQYNVEEYHSRREQLIQLMRAKGEWGTFFPAALSPHAYNESAAGLYLPLVKTEAISRGFRWREEPADKREQCAPRSFKHISEVPDSILAETLTCERSGKRFRINPAELQFYRKMSLPLPRFCAEERHRDRLSRRHAFQLYHRNCQHSGTPVQSIYHSDPVLAEIS